MENKKTIRLQIRPDLFLKYFSKDWGFRIVRENPKKYQYLTPWRKKEIEDLINRYITIEDIQIKNTLTYAISEVQVDQKVFINNVSVVTYKNWYDKVTKVQVNRIEDAKEKLQKINYLNQVLKAEDKGELSDLPSSVTFHHSGKSLTVCFEKSDKGLSYFRSVVDDIYREVRFEIDDLDQLKKLKKTAAQKITELSIYTEIKRTIATGLFRYIRDNTNVQKVTKRDILKLIAYSFVMANIRIKNKKGGVENLNELNLDGELIRQKRAIDAIEQLLK